MDAQKASKDTDIQADRQMDGWMDRQTNGHPLVGHTDGLTIIVGTAETRAICRYQQNEGNGNGAGFWMMRLRAVP